MEQLLYCLVQLCRGKRLLDVKYEQVRRQVQLKEQLKELETTLKGNKRLIKHFLRYLDVDVWDGYGYLTIDSFFSEFDEMRLYPDTLVCFDLTTERYYRFVYLMYAKFGDKIFDVPLDVDVETDTDIDIDNFTGEQLWELFNKYRSQIEQMGIDKAKETLNVLKGKNKSLFKLALRIKQYEHVIDDKYEQKLENWIKQKKIKKVHDSLTKLIDKYALSHLRDGTLDADTKTMYEARFEDVIVKLEQYSYVSIRTIEEIASQCNVSINCIKLLLQGLGFKRQGDIWVNKDTEMKQKPTQTHSYYYDIYRRLYNDAKQGLIDETKLTPTEKKIYRLVKRILQYRHAFTDDDISWISTT